MIFWLCVILLFIGIALIPLDKLLYRKTKYGGEWVRFVGIAIIILCAFAIFIMTAFITADHITAKSQAAAYQQQYDSLTYQLENNLYDNDNDIGKKALYQEIQEWNSNLAYHKTVQRDFWIGIFYPNIYDQFEFIEYN
jgi:predicted PurR-regulated permease PerM